MRKLLSLLLCATLVLAAAGCSSNPNTPGNTPASAKKVINYANGVQPEVLDYISSVYAKTSIVMYNIYSGLCHIGPSGVAELAYADSVKTSDDGLVWTFHIREDAKWSNGEKLTAHDWEETFEYLLNPNVNTRNWELKKYIKNSEQYKLGECTWEEVGCKALDDYTLEFTLKAPCTYFLDLCCTYIPLYLKTIRESEDWAKKPETYITNGAFRVREIVDQTGFYTEKNPYYYNADNVKIDEVNFIWIDDESVELASYKNGTINVSDSLSAEALQTYKDTPDFHAAERIGVNYMTLNTEHISNPLVRQAMSFAIDRNQLLKILGGVSKPATGLVPYGIHWGDKQWRDAADEKNGGDLVYYDLQKAKDLLAQAGHPNGEGLPEYIYICKNNATDKAQALQDMWKQIGINVRIETYESSVYWDVFDTDNWDIGDDGWTGDYDDPNTNLFLWEEYREVNPDGTLKDARWVSEAAKEYDRLMKMTYPETDYEKRMELFREAEKVIVSDMPVIPIFFYTDTFLVNPKVSGVLKCYIGHVFFEYADIQQ